MYEPRAERRRAETAEHTLCFSVNKQGTKDNKTAVLYRGV